METRPAAHPAASSAARTKVFFDGPVERLMARIDAMRDWEIFVFLFFIVVLLHATLLNLPYFWDEAGYYVLAARDLLNTGSIIPYSTQSGAHPPLSSIYLAAWWKIFGYAPIISRIAMLMVSAGALAAVFRICRRLVNIEVAIAATACTLWYPVWFAQSSLTHADLLAAACTLWGTAYYLEERINRAALFFSLAAIAKETAIIASLTLGGWELIQLASAVWAERRAAPDALARFKNPLVTAKSHAQRMAVLIVIPSLPLSLWYVFHFVRTGHIFGNSEFFQYNVAGTLSFERFGLALLQRLWHITAHMNLFVLTLAAVVAMFFKVRRQDARRLNVGRSRPETAGETPRSEINSRRRNDLSPDRRPGIRPGALAVIWLLISAYVVTFSVLGGALLTRYLLPIFPLLMLLEITVLWRRISRWGLVAALVCASFAAGLVFNPPYSYAFEDNLAYRDFVALHQQAANYIDANYPRKRIITAWTASDEISNPVLGYVTIPAVIMPVENFSRQELDRLGEKVRFGDAVLMFSTQYRAGGWSMPRFQWWERSNRKFFDYHQDLGAEEVASLLGGRIRWQAQRGVLKVAVIDLPHSLH